MSDIIDSVREDPKIFQFKTKGILLGTSEFTELDRKRFELHFNDPAYEGLLDGGHNMLALGIYFLGYVMDEKDLRKIKLWEDMKAAWIAICQAIKPGETSLLLKCPLSCWYQQTPRTKRR